ncbi:MAG TPA: DUF4382 domain-containing protein [Candidatus Acidoferrum sp.]|nr:DUF4382 domain-containing protein [Candidatus Acidoferrum sp.]
MLRNKALFLLVLVSALASSSCTLHRPNGGGCCSGGNHAFVSLTISDAPPVNTAAISFNMPILGVTLTPSSGNAVSLFSPTTAANFELTRLQSDTALIATNVSVPTGTYTSLKLTLAAPSAVLFNGSGAGIGSCANNSVCSQQGSAATITFSFPTGSPLVLTANQNQFLDLDFNYNNAIVSTSSSVTIDATQSNVLTVLTAPITGVPNGDLANIDDFTGLVTAVSSSNITVKSTMRGSLTASISSSTIPVNDPQFQCAGGGAFSCIQQGSTIVSLQSVLTSASTVDGTELDVIDNSTTPADEAEGTLYTNASCASGFGMILSDSAILSTSSPLAGAPFGANICVALGPTATFAIDDGILTNQAVPTAGFTSSADLFAGQTVRVKVSNAASGTNVINVTASTVVLRFSRLTATVNNVTGSTFTITGLPAYFASTPTTTPSVQTYPNATIFEGVTNGISGLSPGQTVSISALFLNPVTSTQPFQAAKVRVP